MNTFLTIVGWLAVVAVAFTAGSWRTSRKLGKVVLSERREKRAAQAETARLTGQRDRLIKTGIEARGAVHAMWLDWWDFADEQYAVHGRALDEIHELEELIRERGMHDDAVAAAHEAEIVEADETPTWAELTGTFPLPLGTGHTTEIRRDLMQAALEAAAVSG